jgi:DNA-binding protein Alba
VSEKQQSRKLILVNRTPLEELVLNVILTLRELKENEVLVLKGRGDYIPKAIDVYNEVKKRLGNALVLENVSIGSEKAGRRILSYIEISLKFTM